MQQVQNQRNQPKFCYELLSEFTIHQKQLCNAITFNQNKQLLLVCCDQNIKVYQFNDGYLKLIQILPKSRYANTVLSFFQNDRKCQFLSGSCDSFIKVRSITQLRNQKYTQRLDSHKRAISCLAIGQDQNMFLSGCVDQTIKLWSCFQQNYVSCQWSCQQTITDHTNDVYTLDINSKQNKAVSCGYDDTILIMEIIKYMDTYQLILKQKIKLKNCGFRILFINDSDFIFQTYCGQFLQLFQQDQNEKYVIAQSMPVQCQSYSQDQNNESLILPLKLGTQIIFRKIPKIAISSMSNLISILLTIVLQYIFLALIYQVKTIQCLQKQLKSQFFLSQPYQQ